MDSKTRLAVSLPPGLRVKNHPLIGFCVVKFFLCILSANKKKRILGISLGAKLAKQLLTGTGLLLFPSGFAFFKKGENSFIGFRVRARLKVKGQRAVDILCYRITL